MFARVRHVCLVGIPAFVIAFAPEICAGQPTPGLISEPGLGVHLVARRVVSPAGTAPTLHWVADPFPPAENIKVTNKDLASRLAGTLARLARGDEMCPTWVFEISHECTFGERLRRELRDFSFRILDNVNLLDPPEKEGLELDVTLRVEYSVPTVVALKTLAVHVSTERASSGASALTLTLLASEAAQRAGLPQPPAELRASPLTVDVTEEDRAHPGGVDYPIDRLQNELFKVALNTLTHATRAGLVPGKPVLLDSQLTSLDDDIGMVYKIERPNWPPANVGTVRDPGGDLCTIHVTRLRFVAAIDAEVVRGTTSGADGLKTFEGFDQADEERIQTILRKATEDAKAFLHSSSLSIEGTIPTRAAVQAIVDEFRQLPRARPPIDVQSTSDGRMIFQTTYRFVESELNAKLAVQANFDPEQLFTGGGKIHAHNIIYHVVKKELGEDIDVDLSGGPEAQNIHFDLNITRERGVRHVVTYGFDFLMLYTRDRDQRMGNRSLQAGEDGQDVQLLDREYGLQPKLFLQYERAGAWKARLRWEGLLDWRQVLVRPESEILPPLTDGLLSAWDNTFDVRFGRDFSPQARDTASAGISEVALMASATLRRATTQLSGDFEFSRSLLWTSAETLFGWKTRRELLARYRWGWNDASSGTPLFQLHRLGGPDNVRGLEEGEFVGREIGFQQYTIGVGLAAFISGLADAEGQLAALASSYVTAFYDHGHVDLGGARHAVAGYGVAVEIRGLPAGKQRANISIGWARSPQSLHRRGVMTLGVNFSL